MILRDTLIFQLVRTLNVHSRAFFISKRYNTIPLLFKNTTLFLVCICKIQKSLKTNIFFLSHVEITLIELIGHYFSLYSS